MWACAAPFLRDRSARSGTQLRKVTDPPARPRSELCRACHERPSPGSNSALSFPRSCGPSSAARSARRSRLGAFAWRTSSGTFTGESVPGRATDGGLSALCSASPCSKHLCVGHRLHCWGRPSGNPIHRRSLVSKWCPSGVQIEPNWPYRIQNRINANNLLNK